MKKNRKLRSLALVLLALCTNSCHLKLGKTQDINYTPLIKQLKGENWRSADVECRSPRLESKTSASHS